MPGKFFAIIVIVFGISSFLIAEDWPRWRGPRQDGIAQESGLLKQWPAEGPKKLWSAPLSGGFSSMIVFDGSLYANKRKQAGSCSLLGCGNGKRSMAIQI